MESTSLCKTTEISFFGHPLSMHIYDYTKAQKINLDGTSSGGEALDIISKCLENDKCWEPYQTEITKEILKDGKNIFIDIGAHLGYYSLLASVYDNQTISIDKNTKYLDLFKKTITYNKVQNINILEMSIDENFSLDFLIDHDTHVKLIKCDIEGCEIEFVDSILERLKNNKIENLILEISPNMRDNYPEYVMKIKDLGYFVYDIGLSPQRELNSSTTLESLEMLTINNIEDMRNYIKGFPEKQSNFLFSTINYVK